MRFRIIKRNDDCYMPQVFNEISGGWSHIGSFDGYETMKEAKKHCVKYKNSREPEIVEEFVI